MKKIWLLAPFLFYFSHPLFAQELADCGCIGKNTPKKSSLCKCKQEHKRKNPCEQQKCTSCCRPADPCRKKPPKQSFCKQEYKRKDPCAQLECLSCCLPEMSYRLPLEFTGYSGFIETLIWQVQSQASHFVATPTDDTALHLPTTSSAIHGQVQSASFDWNGGFRLGFGYTFVRDAWQALAQYTWFATKGDNKFLKKPSTTQFLMPTFTNLDGERVKQAESSAHFTYQMADVLMARRFLINPRIQLQLFLGATGGRVKEKFHATYRNVTMNSYVANSWTFGGGGFRTGMDANWHIIEGFGFFGKVSFAMLLGKHNMTNRITADEPGVSSFGVLSAPHIANTHFSGIYLLPATQIILGFDWYRAFGKCCWVKGVRAAVAGEFNNLANLQQIFKTTMEPTSLSWPGKIYVRDISNVYMYGANVLFGGDF